MSEIFVNGSQYAQFRCLFSGLFLADRVGGGRNRPKSEVEQLPRGGGGPGQDEHAPDINTDHYLLWPQSTTIFFPANGHTDVLCSMKNCTFFVKQGTSRGGENKCTIQCRINFNTFLFNPNRTLETTHIFKNVELIFTFRRKFFYKGCPKLPIFDFLALFIKGGGVNPCQKKCRICTGLTNSGSLIRKGK